MSDSDTVTNLPYIGKVIQSHYLVQELLGEGSFGVVYEVRDLRTADTTYAMKMLRPAALKIPGITQRYIREICLMANLEHPNIVKILGHGVYRDEDADKGLPFALMERLEGQTLGELLDEEIALRERETIEIIDQVLAGLGEVHCKGIVHRDLKPDNIFLCKGDEVQVKLLDFGIAKAVDGDWDDELVETLTVEGMTMGTPLFMAPEQIRGKVDVTPALDVYALGCIVYFMLTGEPVFEGKNQIETAMLHLTTEPPEVPEAYRDGPLGPLIAHSLSKAPEERYPNAIALRNELHRQISLQPAKGTEADVAQIVADRAEVLDKDPRQAETAPLDKTVIDPSPLGKMVKDLSAVLLSVSAFFS